MSKSWATSSPVTASLAETLRLNLGYERQLGTAWSAGIDLIYAEGDHLQRNFDDNAQIASRDEFGRPIYSDAPVNPNFNTIFVRRSNGESEYTALTLKVAAGSRRCSSGSWACGCHSSEAASIRVCSGLKP